MLSARVLGAVLCALAACQLALPGVRGRPFWQQPNEQDPQDPGGGPGQGDLPEIPGLGGGPGQEDLPDIPGLGGGPGQEDLPDIPGLGGGSLGLPDVNCTDGSWSLGNLTSLLGNLTGLTGLLGNWTANISLPCPGGNGEGGPGGAVGGGPGGGDRHPHPEWNETRGPFNFSGPCFNFSWPFGPGSGPATNWTWLEDLFGNGTFDPFNLSLPCDGAPWPLGPGDGPGNWTDPGWPWGNGTVGNWTSGDFNWTSGDFNWTSGDFNFSGPCGSRTFPRGGGPGRGHGHGHGHGWNGTWGNGSWPCGNWSTGNETIGDWNGTWPWGNGSLGNETLALGNLTLGLGNLTDLCKNGTVSISAAELLEKAQDVLDEILPFGNFSLGDLLSNLTGGNPTLGNATLGNLSFPCNLLMPGGGPAPSTGSPAAGTEPAQGGGQGGQSGVVSTVQGNQQGSSIPGNLQPPPSNTTQSSSNAPSRSARRKWMPPLLLSVALLGAHLLLLHHPFSTI